LRGNGRYTDDFSYPDQAVAVFVRSPHAHARIARIETSAAESSPGVIAVLTGHDYLADGHAGIVHAAPPTDAADPRQPAFDYAHGHPPFDTPQLPLATERVRVVGETFVVVVAASAVQARAAA